MLHRGIGAKIHLDRSPLPIAAGAFENTSDDTIIENDDLLWFPLVNIQKTMEDQHFLGVNHGKSTISMAMFTQH